MESMKEAVHPKLIVALDFDKISQALSLVDDIDPKQCALKVGSEMFTGFGPTFVKQLVDRNFKVFLDLKFHDIPNTVARSCKASADLGIWMMNVHAMGGLAMMQAAKKALESYKAQAPILIAVTVLTSASEEQLKDIGLQTSMNEQVIALAALAKSAGLDGVVSSAHEVASIKKICGSGFLAVTPGIRMPQDVADDQNRTMTPQAAIEAGSDYLVIGRPITQSTHPSAIIRDIINTVNLGDAHI